MRAIILVFQLVILSGCAGNEVREFSREEYKRLTTKTYSDTTEEKLIEAAKRVIEKSDPDDVRFAWMDNGFAADRDWLTYFVIGGVFGVNHFEFTVDEVDNKSFLAKLKLGASAGAVTASPVVGGGGSVNGVSADNSGSGNIPPAAAQRGYGDFTYVIFWERLDYELGLTDAYLTCSKAEADAESGKYFYLDDPQYNPFCSFSSESIMPNGESEIGLRRAETKAKRCKPNSNCASRNY